MITETVLCDRSGCMVASPLRGSMVPDAWVTSDGRHYCSRDCAITAWWEVPHAV